MDNTIDKKQLKKQLEQLSWYELMTSQQLIDSYVEHIRESSVPYECKDEEKEKEAHVKDFQRMLNKRGRTILKELFSDIHINEPFGDRLTEFATRFSQSYKRTGWLYWLQEIVSYTSTVLMWYAFLDKEEQETTKNTPSEVTRTKAAIVDLQDFRQKRRDERTYTEVGVKRILYAFARDIGCKWSKKRLETFIEKVFDFD